MIYFEGFEKSKNGKSHPVKSGILIHERDEEVILATFEKHKEEIMKKVAEKNRKEVLKLWKGVCLLLMINLILL